MLILNRKIGGSIVINDNIIITILNVDGLQVKIGIDAPKEVKVYRKEVYNKILSENENKVVNTVKKGKI